MSNRFRVAFREKLCADNPCTRASCFCCCCWKRWRDCQTYRNGRSVSSSSQREDPVIVPQLQASLKEKSPALGRCIGISLSEENLKSIEKDRPHFNSDPNLFPEACC
ncbi:hypothetical protein CDAR_29131 [Caerostris darwini]|uniref:Uncharacterized protein n=1 Tax=Caerostris darwini TaxID=1538125 RepID=A0AAV4V449_9ARAC|nr:hypothetical protein CDAR_29131 [Caerostris darwini]